MKDNKQSLAVAYSLKRKAKKMAQGGAVQAPMSDVQDHYESIADAILAKKRKMLEPTDEIDGSEQAVERPSVEEDLNEMANAQKPFDLISSARKKMKSKR